MMKISRQVMNAMMTNKLTVIIWLLMGFGALSACGNSSDARKFHEAVLANDLGIVSIEVTSTNDIVEVDGEENYTATATLDSGATLDVSDRVRWSTSDSSVAGISQSGKAIALANGMIEVRAELADLSDTRDLIVSDAPLTSIDVSSDIVGGGQSVGVCSSGYQLTATGNYDDSYGPRTITHLVTWASNAPEIADVDSSGIIVTYKDGTAPLLASRNTVSSTPWELDVEDNLTSVVITPAVSSLSVGNSQQFIATGTYVGPSTAVITPSVTWSASNTDGSTSGDYLGISNEAATKGLATALAAGDATVTAVCASTTAALVTDATVTVTVAVKVADVKISGTTRVDSNDSSPVQLVATLINNDSTTAGIVTDSDDIVWRVGETIEGVAATVSNVSGSKGEVSFTGAGKTEIKVTYDDGVNDYNDTITFTVD